MCKVVATCGFRLVAISPNFGYPAWINSYHPKYLSMTIAFQPRWYFFISLISVTFIGPLSLHLFIPAMPVVKEAFAVSTGMAQLTMSLAMLSMAFFTVAYG